MQSPGGGGTSHTVLLSAVPVPVPVLQLICAVLQKFAFAPVISAESGVEMLVSPTFSPKTPPSTFAVVGSFEVCGQTSEPGYYVSVIVQLVRATLPRLEAVNVTWLTPPD